MKFSITIFTALLTAGFIQSAVGLKCDSNCAACWLDGNTDGADTKFQCNGGHCGNSCPAGYSGIHCANGERCSCTISNRGRSCDKFGPCACGVRSPNQYDSYCNTPCW